MGRLTPLLPQGAKKSYGMEAQKRPRAENVSDLLTHPMGEYSGWGTILLMSGWGIRDPQNVRGTPLLLGF